MSKPLRNDAIASIIAGALVNVHPFQFTERIRTILDRHIPARRSTPGILDHGAARAGDARTSVEAAAQVNVTRQQRAILQTLAVATIPLHTADLAKFTGLKLGSASTRMRALVDHGFVQEVGTREYEGRSKTTYSITDQGRTWISGGHHD
jgi:DNA-binding MarR family transcriptional regulator